MKYDEKKFFEAVANYKKSIGNSKGRDFLVIFSLKDKDAFYSIAPLSRAVHDLKGEMSALGFDGDSDSFNALLDVWKANEEAEKGAKSDKAKALKAFIE